MAATHFTEGVKVYQRHRDLCHTDAECMKLATQIYTNRALSWHSIDNQADAFADANYVLSSIDPDNTKALFRRAHCYRLKHQYALALHDLEHICRVDPKNTAVKKDLITLKTLLSQESKTKIQEVEVQSTPAPQAKTTPPAEEEEQPKAKKEKRVVNNTRLLNADVISKASAQASEEASNEALQSIPKTAAGFEKDFNQLKKNSQNVYRYLVNIPSETVSSIFKNSEVQYEIFKGALEAISKHGLGDQEATRKSASFLVAWSKASSFDMTLMFIEDSERAVLK